MILCTFSNLLIYSSYPEILFFPKNLRYDTVFTFFHLLAAFPHAFCTNDKNWRYYEIHIP